MSVTSKMVHDRNVNTCVKKKEEMIKKKKNGRET